MFVFKLVALYQALMSLKNKFPAVQADVVALYGDIEAAIVTEDWLNVAVVRKLVTDVEHLVSDFADSWTGSTGEWDAFVAAVKEVL